MNPDIKMSDPMEILNANLPEQYKGVQQYMMDHYSAVDNVLDPQLAWLVRNMAYQRALIISQDEKIRFLAGMLEAVILELGGSDE